MKKNVWSASPSFLILTLPTLFFSIACWIRGDRPLAYAGGGVFLLEVIALLAVILHFRNHILMAVKAARQILGVENYQAVERLSLPVAVVGEAGDIIWCNTAFTQGVNGKKEALGENILRFIYPKNVRQVVDAEGTDITAGEKNFTVFGVRVKNIYVLYFIDDTYYKEINRVYTETRPVVMLAHFDNREELSGDASGTEDARITSQVESKLMEWASDMNGFFKRLSGGRYLILTDEIHIRGAAEKRFEILDQIRTVKADEYTSATVSIGVGRGAENLKEAELWARKALDMALGRGGDQVAVKQKGDTYEFFGGLSKGVEKRDKVRTRVIAATLSDHVRSSDAVFIMGHRFSDLDAIGAAVGLWSAVTKALQKPAYVVINRAQSLAGPILSSMEEKNPDKNIFVAPQDAMAMITPKSMLVVVDTHSPDFVESRELLDAVSRVVVIDHHRMMVRHIKNAVVFYHEPYASSASEMVAELVQYIGENSLSRREAEALLSGIMLDTKNFVLKTGVRTFEAAAYLRRRGADTVEVKRMFSDSPEAYRAKHEIVACAEISGRSAYACAAKEFPEIRVTAAQAADELLSIQGVAASFVLFSDAGSINISARSLGEMNVQLVMERLGGGGHLTMAGAQLRDVTMEEALEKVKDAVRQQEELVVQKTV